MTGFDFPIFRLAQDSLWYCPLFFDSDASAVNPGIFISHLSFQV
jgi:hypothetical protein